MKLWLDLCLGKYKQRLYPLTQSCETLMLQSKIMVWTSLNHPVIITVTIRVWNIIRDLLCNKYGKGTWRISPFSMLQAKKETLFAFSNVILGKSNISFCIKDIIWMECGKIKCGEIKFSLGKLLYNCNH